jgi:hypothetical protein
MTPTYAQALAWFTPTREARFWRNIEKTADGCWLWRGAKKESGHGQIDFDGHSVRVHRLTWLLARQQDLPEFIPDNHGEYKPFVVRHLMCDHKNCCNPSHCVGGTQTENLEDNVMIHLAYKLDTERRAREEYSKHPYIGYFSDRWSFPIPPVAETSDRQWVGFPMHTPAMPLQSLASQ